MLSFVKRALVCTALASCAAPDEGALLGHVDLAIVATGSDGATYRLPPATSLLLRGDTVLDVVPLDGDETTISVEFPAGEYTATLLPGSYTTEWPLQRTADGVTQTVMATLLTSVPISVTVLEGEHTPVVLSFRAAVAGTVTFAQGALDVSVDVSTTETSGGQAHLDAEVVVTSASIDEDAPPEVVPHLPAAGQGGTIGDLHVEITGPWVQRARDYVCAPITCHGVGVGGHGFVELVLESLGGRAELCATPVGVSITLWRDGAPRRDLFRDLGLDPISVMAELSIDIPGVVQGGTLDLRALAGTHQAPASVSLLFGSDIRFAGGRWFTAFSEGDGAFTFVPQE